MEPLYKGHIGTLYIEVVLNSEVIYSGTSLYIGTLKTVFYIEFVSVVI